MNNILHITPHLGGGVGKVLLNWIIPDNINHHEIATLDFANEKSIRLCKENNISLFSEIKINDLLKKIKKADIVLIHFWNHPLLYDFLIRNPLPESRIIIWSHIMGNYPPYVYNKKLLDICDKFVFSSDASKKYFKNSSKTASILSTGGIEDFDKIKIKKHSTYNLAYIGTVDFAKMHPDFVKTMEKTSADKIFIVGGKKEKEIFKGCSKKFIVKGETNDIISILKESDVFCYMLNKNHYGTGEQALQEAMAIGVVPVVLNNDCEKNLVAHNKTGLIAKNKKEYINYIDLLKNDIDLRKKLSKNAKIYAKNNFSLDTLKTEWQKVFNEIMKIKKTQKKWKINKQKISSFDIFLESLGEYSDIFENKTNEELKKLLKKPNWQSETKATPKQYFKFLSGKELEKICSLYEN